MLFIFVYMLRHANKISTLSEIMKSIFDMLDISVRWRVKLQWKDRTMGNVRTLTSDSGFCSWWCSSFDLLYRSITDFMLKKIEGKKINPSDMFKQLELLRMGWNLKKHRGITVSNLQIHVLYLGLLVFFYIYIYYCFFF